MACLVEIANTTHLAYSPANEKHNILYNRARHILNERHFQRPWFNLNPSLDRQDGDELGVDKWKDSMEIQPLQSLVIVEDYFNDKPLGNKELSIAEFWDFLFEDWSDGYSIRVLEGRLQDMLVTELVNMVTNGFITQHSTFAFAKNSRPRLMVYKHSLKTETLGTIEETLLLEFTYYGHIVSKNPQDSSSSYPASTADWTFTSASDNPFSDLDTSSDGRLIHTEPSGLHKQTSNISTKTVPQVKRKKKVRIDHRANGQLVSTCDRSVQLRQGSDSCHSGHRGIQDVQGISRRSSGTESWRRKPPQLDLKKFLCTEQVSYLGEFELEDSSGSEDEDSNHFGQEFYLGNRRPHQLEDDESVSKKLQRRKAERLKLREADRLMYAELMKEVKTNMYCPNWDFDFNLDNYNPEFYVGYTPDGNIPDFYDFIDPSKTDESSSVVSSVRERFSKAVRVSKRLKARAKAKAIKPKNEEFADKVHGVTDSVPCKKHCLDADEDWKKLPHRLKHRYLRKKNEKANGTGKERKRRRRRRKVDTKPGIPLIYVTTTLGVTYLHPVSKLHMIKLQKRQEKHSYKKKTEAAEARRRVSVAPIPSPKDLSNLLKKSTQSQMEAVKQEKSEMKYLDKVTFPKLPPFVDSESPDEEEGVEEEDDFDEDSAFDVQKLNLKYSIERIKKAKRAKEAKNKPHTFHNILKKYYRLQSVLRAFDPNVKKRRNSTAGLLGLKPKKKKLLPSFLQQKNDKKKQKFELGKMKWYSFLDKPKVLLHREDVDGNLFENFPLDVFRKNVERSLNEFVVRREIVVSDYHAKTSVSITFTKKSVFTKYKNTA